MPLEGAQVSRPMAPFAAPIIATAKGGHLPNHEPIRRISPIGRVYRGGALGLIIGTLSFLALIFMTLLRGGSSTCVLSKSLLETPICKTQKCELSVPFILIVEVAFMLMGAVLGGIGGLFSDRRHASAEAV